MNVRDAVREYVRWREKQQCRERNTGEAETRRQSGGRRPDRARPHAAMRHLWLAVVLVAVGSGGGSLFINRRAAPQRDPTIPMALQMIHEAGLPEYAELGQRLYADGVLRPADPVEMPDPGYITYCDLERREILISTTMAERYPSRLDQAGAILHELVHWRSTETTHQGPWWSALSKFEEYRETSEAARR